ncbi:MAG TPA: glutamine-hydrolyzing carbamoyl-phosphate synthase small subunit, partial [Actinomycetota bacterium]|nr:glutamine-hydrolyzing carbamoyl-phosphate synthase small subunit [Actinomycetota bacterium]
MKKARLVLEDAEVFEGLAFGADQDAVGEVVFNTGMCGYQEVLTDPSYEGQIVSMTYPHIGNYGVNPDDVESARPRVSGFVIRDLPVEWSSWRATQGLDDYLRSHGICGITEIDTRRLTRHIRDKGAMRGTITSAETPLQDVLRTVQDHPSMEGADLVGKVTAAEPFEWPVMGTPAFKVAAYDFGIKYNILRLLAAHGCQTTVFPATTPASEVLASAPDGVFLSNGPGDPEAVSYGIKAVRGLVGKVPIFGICLGHQLIALALGLNTYKMKFGHRGVNHPVARLSDGAIEITTQNHGFAVSSEVFGVEIPDAPGQGLPSTGAARTDFGELELTHLNLNDYTVEGFKLLQEPVFAVQYHPEAGPG